ncbi:MAG: tetratricopeptide repeat protein [Magnetococcales bacterium]|nr:tetratricopeptide repeat protein [Magnetococcales bacterium]
MSRKMRRAQEAQARRGGGHRKGRIGDLDQHLQSLFRSGMECQQQRDWPAAAGHYEEALTLRPDQPAFLVNLGMVLYAMGQRERAEGLWHRAIAVEPDQAAPFIFLGSAALDKGHMDQAVALNRKALLLEPDNILAHNNLGVALRRMGDLDGALRALDRAVALAPRHAEAWANRGAVLQDREDWTRAEDNYRKALDLLPGHPGHAFNLADLLERGHRLDEARAVLTRALERSPGHGELQLILARVERRQGDPQGALRRLEALGRIPGALWPIPREICFELGRLYDQLDRPTEALAAFTDGHRLQTRDWQFQSANPGRFMGEVEMLSHYYRGLKPQPPGPPGPDQTPLFIVGFPRSGTTLLGRMLDARSDMTVVVESSTSADLLATLPGKGPLFPRKLAALNPAARDRLRADYLARLRAAHGGEVKGRLVDQQPFNMVWLELITTLFPGAPILFMQRHPCDVCLSCFMQDFQPNKATAHFATLATTVELYARMMELWWLMLDRLTPNVKIVGYENLVTNPDQELGWLTQYLGIGWDPAMLDFHQRPRRTITTASYQQVTRPLYQESRGRWQRYAFALEPHMDRLRPLIGRLGYPAP